MKLVLWPLKGSGVLLKQHYSITVVIVQKGKSGLQLFLVLFSSNQSNKSNTLWKFRIQDFWSWWNFTGNSTCRFVQNLKKKVSDVTMCCAALHFYQTHCTQSITYRHEHTDKNILDNSYWLAKHILDFPFLEYRIA